jgi:peptide/nickel transport system ATP-binding protein
MCERLIVMRNAEPVEILTREELRAGDVHHGYSKQLLAAS